MRTLGTAIAALLLAPGLALAQVHASAGIHIDLPILLPQLVVVSPGVQVVPEVRHEVFFVDGFYWARHDRGWYRSKSHRGGWVLVPGRAVPARLGKIPHGKYRNWKAPRPAPAPAYYRGHDDDRGRRHDRDHREHDRDRGRGHDDRGRGHDHDRGHDHGDKHGRKGGRH